MLTMFFAMSVWKQLVICCLNVDLPTTFGRSATGGTVSEGSFQTIVFNTSSSIKVG